MASGSLLNTAHQPISAGGLRPLESTAHQPVNCSLLIGWWVTVRPVNTALHYGLAGVRFSGNCRFPSAPPSTADGLLFSVADTISSIPGEVL